MYKILIADDEDIIRRGLAGMVSQHPKLEVAALAEDGEIALEQAARTRPDLMLVDINMPFVDGFAFIKEAKQLLPEAEIIIVTGYDDFAFAQKALQLGVADYLLKPIMEEPFFAVLDKAISRLDNRATSRKYINWLTQQLERNRPSLLGDFFRRWLRGSMDQLDAVSEHSDSPSLLGDGFASAQRSDAEGQHHGLGAGAAALRLRQHCSGGICFLLPGADFSDGGLGSCYDLGGASPGAVGGIGP